MTIFPKNHGNKSSKNLMAEFHAAAKQKLIQGKSINFGSLESCEFAISTLFVGQKPLNLYFFFKNPKYEFLSNIDKMCLIWSLCPPTTEPTHGYTHSNTHRVF